MAAGMHHLVDDAGLLEVILTGVCVVGIHNYRHVLKIFGLILLVKAHQVLIVVVGPSPSGVVHIAPENGMGQGIALRLHLPAAIGQHMGMLGRSNRVEHHAQVAGGGVLHAHRHRQTAGHQTMLLVLHRACAHGHIAQHIRQVAVVAGIEHLIGAGKAGFIDRPHMHMPHGDQALDHIGLLRGVRLGGDALIAVAGGAGLIGVNPGHHQNLILDLFLNGNQPMDILQHRILPIRRAGADNQQDSIILAGKNICNLLVALCLGRCPFFGQGNGLLHLFRRGKLPEKFHVL